MNHAFILRIVSVVFLFVLSPALTASDPQEASLEARFAAVSATYERSIDLLEDDPAEGVRLLDTSIAEFRDIAASLQGTSAALEFNLGNAYFHRGDLGLAILHYRRAECFDRLLPGLRANLALARSRIQPIDEYAGDAEGLSGRVGVFFSAARSFTAGAWLVAVLWSAGWILALLRATRIATMPRWLILLPIAFSVLLAGVLFYASSEPSLQIGVVVDEAVIARTGPGERSYPPVFASPIPTGTELTIEEVRAGWLYVRFPNGRTAWVPAEGIGIL